MYFLGYDIGSSSVKVSLLNGATGKFEASAISDEQNIETSRPGWAEQDPEMWWRNIKSVTHKILSESGVDSKNIMAIGIAYQMHGLVIVDKDHNGLRPAIIWCDSRAAETGQKAFEELGEKYCLENFLNLPGNFTASKLKWVQQHEPEIYERIFKMMLPGDYIVMKMSGDIQTTVSGLSEAILWNFHDQTIAESLLRYYGIEKYFLPKVTDTFSVQSELSASAAKELGLTAGTKISYRCGDQPNNAFALNVLNPGEAAANAGTSGVIYSVTDKNKYDAKSRVNTFVHVNNSKEKIRNGILLCVNGAGILNSWLKKTLAISSYETMNELAAQAPAGSDGLLFHPFGNGAERIFENINLGASMKNLQLNIHQTPHVLRAAQEGIVFALHYGFQIMQEMGVQPKIVRACEANMFLSPVFREVFASTTETVLELYQTDGSQGAARGAALGAGYYSNLTETFHKLEKRMTIEPNKKLVSRYKDAYSHWLQHLNKN